MKLKVEIIRQNGQKTFLYPTTNKLVSNNSNSKALNKRRDNIRTPEVISLTISNSFMIDQAEGDEELDRRGK